MHKNFQMLYVVEEIETYWSFAICAWRYMPHIIAMRECSVDEESILPIGNRQFT